MPIRVLCPRRGRTAANRYRWPTAVLAALVCTAGFGQQAAPPPDDFDALISAPANTDSNHTAQPDNAAAPASTTTGSTDSTSNASTSPPASQDSPATVATIPVQELPKEPEKTPKAKNANRRQIEEIVVTAQKKEQSLQDVPISISAMSGQQMRELGANDLPAIAAYTPNVKFSSDSDPALAQVNIRGFGSSPLNAAFESSVGFVEDEIFFGRPTYFTEAIFDVDRVEVLRGPQGTLFGKNTSAGLFNVISKSPTEQFSGDIRTSYYPRAKERRVEAGVGGMFAEWGGVRVSGLDIDRVGVLQNTKLNRTDDQHRQQAGRLKLLLLPLDNLKLDINAVKSNTDITYWPLQLYKLSSGTKTYLQGFDPKVEDDPYNQQMSTDQAGYLKKGSSTVSLKSEYSFGSVAGIDDLKLTWINGYSQIFIDAIPDGDQSPANIIDLKVYSNHHQRSSEPRISGVFRNGLFGLGQNLEFTLGAFYFHGDFYQSTRVAAGKDFGSFLATDSALRQVAGPGGLSSVPLSGLGPATTLFNTLGAAAIGDDSYNLFFNQKSTTNAIFGQAIWRLDEHWSLIPAARVSSEAKLARASSLAVCRTAPNCVTSTALGGKTYDQTLDRTERDFSPKLAVQYAFDSDINVFTSYAKGYKSGGLNAASFSGNNGQLAYDPENVTSYEAGIKTTLLDRTLTFNATAFFSDFQNLQVLNIQGAAITVSNAATATAKGLEVDTTWLTPWQFLEMRGSLGLLRARYGSYPKGPPTIDMPSSSTQDLSGRPLTFAPNTTASFSPTVRFPLFGNVGGQFTVDALYQSSQFTNLDLDPNTLVKSHTTFSARFIVANINGGWSFVLGGSNLTDVKFANQIVNTTVFPGTYAVTQAAGRAIFGALSLNW